MEISRDTLIDLITDSLKLSALIYGGVRDWDDYDWTIFNFIATIKEYNEKFKDCDSIEDIAKAIINN